MVNVSHRGWQNLKIKKPFLFGKTSDGLVSKPRKVVTLSQHNFLKKSGLDETRTRDPLRDRQVF